MGFPYGNIEKKEKKRISSIASTTKLMEKLNRRASGSQK